MYSYEVCKSLHKKGSVERLVRFVKDNFLVGRSFWNVSDLNASALDWCNRQNGIYHKAIDGVPQDIHFADCAKVVSVLDDTMPIRFYLCPERKISFDGFINYAVTKR